MANQFIEGWDTYPVGPFSSSGSPWLVSGTGTFDPRTIDTGTITGPRSLRVPGHTSSISWRRVFPATAEVYCGWSMLFPSGFSSTVTATSNILVGAWGANYTGIHINSSGFLTFRSGGSTLQTASVAVLSNVKHYIEMHLTSTTYEVRLDGVVILSGSMTANGTYTNFGGFRPASGSASAPEFYLDDIYVNDATGTKNNGYLGEISVITMFPNADGTPQDWVPSTGTTAYGILDNLPATLDNVEGVNVGDTMRVEFAPIGVAVTDIHVVQTSFRAQKSTSGANNTQASIIQGGSSAAGVNHSPAETTYAWYQDQFPLDPSTGLDWNPSTFDPSLEIERTL